MLPIQVIIVLFALFTLTRVVRRFHEREISLGGFLAWTAFWTGVGGLVLAPVATKWLARPAGGGPGADAGLLGTPGAPCFFCVPPQTENPDIPNHSKQPPRG